MRVRTVPVTFAEASEFITDWHRHHRPPAGHKFSIGAADEHNVLIGVAVVGRPVARMLQDGLTLTATTDIRTRGILLEWRPRAAGPRYRQAGEPAVVRGRPTVKLMSMSGQWLRCSGAASCRTVG